VVHRGLDETDRGQYDEPCDVGFLSGCCMLFSRSALEALGTFREEYFIYNEDSEWCLRALRRGKRLGYVPSAKLRHRISATMSKGGAADKASPRTEELMVRNGLWMIRAHAHRPWQYAAAVGYLVGIRLVRAAGLVLLGRGGSSAAICRGIAAGLGPRTRR
jgi:GT2 family glycosyltransferase